MTSISKHSILRNIGELRKLLRRLDISGEAFVGSVLSLWCDHDYKGLSSHGLASSSALRQEPRFIGFVETLRHAPFLESTYWLSSAYAMLETEAQRKTLAMFFTPPSLVRGLLDDLVKQGADFASDSFFDPACGGAAFLAPIAIRMREALRERGKSSAQILTHVERNLRGIDIEPTLCAMSRHFLRMALHAEILESGYTPYFKVRTGNSLTGPKSQSFGQQVVICNPPYRKMTAEEIEPLRNCFGHVIEAQPNIYALFIARCIEFAGLGGLVGLVTPTSFLSGRDFRRLRTFLLESTDIAHIGMVSARKGVFIDVEQETALCILRKKLTDKAHPSNVKVSVVSTDGTYADVGECVLPNSGSAWPIPRIPADVALIALATASRFRLADYGYRVRVGLFVWNRDERDSYATWRHADKAGATNALPLIWSKDIVVEGNRAVVAFKPDRTNSEKDAFVDLGTKDHPGVVSRPSVLLQRVTSNDQPLRLVAAEVPEALLEKHGGFVGENHVVILEQEVERPEVAPSQLAALLRSAPVDRYFRCISGATNVSAFELNQLVLPDPALLKLELQAGGSVDAAVTRAFAATGARSYTSI